MNAKQEFIKAIMQVLRLETNIYTMGAIEEIIERLEISDYTLFIAYLGERKADYEKPIESIAKGVDEFYNLKIEPIELTIEQKSKDIPQCIRFYMKDEQNTDINKIIDAVFVCSERKIKISKEDLDLVKSCNSFERFKSGGYFEWYIIEQELYNKLIENVLKPTIVKKIQNKAEDVAEKTLGFCSKSLKNRNLEVLV